MRHLLVEIGTMFLYVVAIIIIAFIASIAIGGLIYLVLFNG